MRTSGNKFDRLLSDISEQVEVIYEAGGDSALAGSKENPRQEDHLAQLRKELAKIEILGIMGRFMDSAIFAEEDIG